VAGLDRNKEGKKAMNKMQEKLAVYARAQRAEMKCRELAIEITALQNALAVAELDREVLAQTVCEGREFGEWVLTLDLSSAHVSKPSEKFREKYSMENSDDVELAMMFAHAQARNKHAV
jgi:hypothetical protein